jgi:hypothetical protein
MKNELFILQTSIILDDILNILQKSKDLNKVESPEDLARFLDKVSFLPFKNKDVDVIVEVSSARSSININSINNTSRMDSLKEFLVKKNIDEEYADMLYDSMNGIKEDGSYKTDIFNKEPNLFRKYVVSYKHLAKINDIYQIKFRDANIQNIDKLFYISKDKNSSIDLNYARALTWELIIGCEPERARYLEDNSVIYHSISDLGLNAKEIFSINKFKTSFFEPIIDVKIDIRTKHMNAKIRFEYNILLKKGSNFVYEV